ncbi:MAG: hypothetical protein ACLR1T_09475 [Evtepia gabavorous]
MSTCCGSPFTAPVCPGGPGETLSYTPEDYQVGVKMRYLFHDGAATLGYLRQGDWRRALAGVADFFAPRRPCTARTTRGPIGPTSATA